MGIKITNLPTTAVNDADYIPVANTTSGTRKVLMQDVLAGANRVPAGGTTGQVLAKASGTDYDTKWTTMSGGGGGGSVEEVFWATYNTTTSAEIEAAYQAEKIVLCEYNGYIYQLTNRTSATKHTFAAASISRSTVEYYLECDSGTWTNFSLSDSSPIAYSRLPENLGTAAVGTSYYYSRGDHVHAMPTAAQVGAIPAPSGPTSGQFLVYDGTAWTAMTLATWSGGNY